MAFLNIKKALFAKKDEDIQAADFKKNRRVNTADPVLASGRRAGQTEEVAQEKQLPIIGKYPYPKQKKILFVSATVIGALFFIFFVVTFLFLGHNARMHSIVTEMQMLSQRMVIASNAGMKGDERGFDDVNEYMERFRSNILAVENESALWLNNTREKANILSRLQNLWRDNFGEANGANMQHVLEQRKQLVSIGQSISEVVKNDSEVEKLISTINRDLSIYEEDKRAVNYFGQLGPLYSRMSKAVGMLMSGNVSARAEYAVLEPDVRKWLQVVRALREGDASVGVPPFRSPALLNALALLDRVASPLSKITAELRTSSAALDNAYLANRLLVQDSRSVADIIGELASFYSNRGHVATLGPFLFALVIVGFLTLYCLVRVLNQESRQKHQQSETESQKNQAAILRLLTEMEGIADGNLTMRAMVTEDLTGAIADSINYTVDELRSLILEINRSAEQVTLVSGRAHEVSDQLLRAAGKQSEEIENTNQAVRMIVQSVQGVAGSATRSSKVAQASLSAAERGVVAVNNQIRGMNEIREQIQETSKRIKRLGESSQEIGEIVELISDITEQTNVLALNAAIQAAAAGEAGRGFSVVAEEVQRLAERSGEATKQIAAIVKTIQSDTQDAVAAMELSTQGVVEGAKLSDAAGSVLSEIGRISHELARLIESITHETEDQSLLAERVNASMRDILSITEQTMRGTRSSAEAIAQLAGFAAGLKSAVARFKV